MKSKTMYRLGILMNILGIAGLLITALFLFSDLQALTHYLQALTNHLQAQGISLTDCLRPQNISSPINFNPTVYVLAVIVSSICAFGGLVIITRHPRKTDPEPATPGIHKSSESALSAYKDIFAQYVDPIGDLHIWRVEAQHKNKDINDGIRRVQDLENFLKRHCDITLDGVIGSKVAYDPKLHYARPEVPEGTQVEIAAPGWKWRDIPLRFPKVR